MKNVAAIIKSVNKKKTSRKTAESVYAPSGLLRTIYNTEEDFVRTENLFKTAKESLAEVNFNEKIFTAKLLMVAAVAINSAAPDLDEKTCNLMKKIAAESDMREGGKKFLEDLGINA